MASSVLEHLAFIVIGLCASIAGCYGAVFTIQNKCPYTIWPAIYNPSAGLELPTGMQTTITVSTYQQVGRIWGRTECHFNAQGTGSCLTGDCGGVLNCRSAGAVPVTFVEFKLSANANHDYYDISLSNGFNLPVAVTPSFRNCTIISCKENINGVCPQVLKTRGACKSACEVYPNSDVYCCRGKYANNCPPSYYSEFFKGECPQAFSYPGDGATSIFACPTGADYTVTFCP